MPEATQADVRAQGDSLGNADSTAQIDATSVCVSFSASQSPLITGAKGSLITEHFPLHSSVAASAKTPRRRVGFVLPLLLCGAALFTSCRSPWGEGRSVFGIRYSDSSPQPNTQHPTPNTSPDQSVQDYLVYHGKRCILGGAIAAVIGLALAIALKQVALQHIGAFVGYCGLGSMFIGIGLAKLASWWVYAGWALAAVLGIGAVILLREHGLDAWLLSKVSVRPKQPKAIRVRRPQAIQVPGSERTISIPLGEAPSDQPSDPEEGEASE